MCTIACILMDLFGADTLYRLCVDEFTITIVFTSIPLESGLCVLCLCKRAFNAKFISILFHLSHNIIFCMEYIA